jgi:hypothetical protein
VNAPVFFSGPFPVAADCAAPACEVISLPEWLRVAESILKALIELQRVMEARVVDGYAGDREKGAAIHVREARNLLRMTMVLIVEDARAGNVIIDLGQYVETGPRAGSGNNFDWWEEQCACELAFLAGCFGSSLHVHYLSRHPEFLPNRHWMVMQALSGSFSHLLSAVADMTTAARLARDPKAKV